MDQNIRSRNRQHLAAALAAGLTVEGTEGSYQVSSQRDPSRGYAVRRSAAGTWTCSCPWSHGLFAAGYDPRSNAIACKHILLAIAQELPAAKQDAIIAADPILRAAIATRQAARRIATGAEVARQAASIADAARTAREFAEEALLACYASWAPVEPVAPAPVAAPVAASWPQGLVHRQVMPETFNAMVAELFG